MADVLSTLYVLNLSGSLFTGSLAPNSNFSASPYTLDFASSSLVIGGVQFLEFLGTPYEVDYLGLGGIRSNSSGTLYDTNLSGSLFTGSLTPYTNTEASVYDLDYLGLGGIRATYSGTVFLTGTYYTYSGLDATYLLTTSGSSSAAEGGGEEGGGEEGGDEEGGDEDNNEQENGENNMTQIYIYNGNQINGMIPGYNGQGGTTQRFLKVMRLYTTIVNYPWLPAFNFSTTTNGTAPAQPDANAFVSTGSISVAVVGGTITTSQGTYEVISAYDGTVNHPLDGQGPGAVILSQVGVPIVTQVTLGSHFDGVHEWAAGTYSPPPAATVSKRFLH